MTNLQQLSTELAALVSHSAPHIVRVESRRRLAATGVALGDGIVVTAHHVLRQDGDITLGLDDGSAVSAELLGRDAATDLAFLKSDAALAKMPTAAEVGQVGNLVLALGRPGKSVQATLGILSALGDGWRTGMGGHIDRYVQTDVVMYPGFSGGPLVNADGAMVGLNTSALVRGVSITIPASTVVRVLADVREHGHVKRGFLGVTTQAVRLPRELRHQLQQKAGLLIVGVESGSPAAGSGLVMGDTIIAVANEPVQNHQDLIAQLSADRIGSKTPFSILRGGQLQSLDVVVGERAA